VLVDIEWKLQVLRAAFCDKKSPPTTNGFTSDYKGKESCRFMTPRVSVILAVFNGEEFLKETIESILDQSFSDFEFIIIDDGSIDNTWELMQHYRNMDVRILLMRNERNKGETYSINLGIHKSRSQLIGITQCGAMSYKSRLEKQYQLFRKNKACVLVGAQTSYCDIKGRTLQCTSFPVNDEDIRKSLYIGRIVFEHPSVMFRKLNGMHYRESTFPEPDFDFWLRVSFYGKLKNINEVLIRRIIHHKRISLTRRYQQKKLHWCIHKLFLERLRYGEEKSTWCLEKSTKKHMFEPFRSQMLHILAKGMFQRKGILRYYYILLNLIFSPAPGKEVYYLLAKRVLLRFYSDRLLRKYLEIAKTPSTISPAPSANINITC
jgi:glycosyltransferase involved in cell wall biosynthesis